MKYQTLIKNVIEYGCGIFSGSMIAEKKERDALWRFVARNPKYFQSFVGRKGDIVLRKALNSSKEYFGAKGRLSSSENWQSLFDIFLVNSYMAETGCWTKYSARPHQINEIGGKKISIFSSKYGFNPKAAECDLILVPPNIDAKFSESQSSLYDECKDRFHLTGPVKNFRTIVLG